MSTPGDVASPPATPAASESPESAAGSDAHRAALPGGMYRFVARGARRRCPRCGVGSMFERWTRMREHCPECDLLFLEDRGDPWAFLMLIDRAAFIFPLVVALYFGLHRVSLVGFVAFGAALGAAFVLTTPNRYGISVGLVHWARWRFGGDRDHGA